MSREAKAFAMALGMMMDNDAKFIMGSTKEVMMWWSVIVGGGGLILIGVCPGDTPEEAVRNAHIDFGPTCGYWESKGYHLVAITQEEYGKKDAENKAWAMGMACR